MLEHLIIFLQKEFKPVALLISLNINFDCKVVVNCLVLFRNKLLEIFCFVLELELLFESFKELINLSNKHKHNTDNDKVEKSELNDQEEDVGEHNQKNPL